MALRKEELQQGGAIPAIEEELGYREHGLGATASKRPSGGARKTSSRSQSRGSSSRKTSSKGASKRASARGR
jgi:hypothetical protein